MTTLFSALHLASLVTSDLANGDYDLLARLTGNRQYTEGQIRQRLHDLGIREVAKPPRMEDSGVEVLFDETQGACWIAIPVWGRGERSNVFVELEVTQSEDVETITLQGIGESVERPVGFSLVPNAEIVDEIRRQERAAVEHEALAKAKMTALRAAPPPAIPEDLRVLAQPIIDGLVDGRYDDVYLLGEARGLSSEDISQTIADISGSLARPPQGLPPSTRYYEYKDGSGANIEIPLWTSEIETDLVAVIVVDRINGTAVSAYLYDIREP